MIGNGKSLHIDQNVSKDELMLDCTLTGSQPSPYNVWFKNGENIPGTMNKKTLSIQGHSVINSGLYQCIAYNDIGATMKLVYITLGITGKFTFICDTLTESSLILLNRLICTEQSKVNLSLFHSDQSPTNLKAYGVSPTIITGWWEPPLKLNKTRSHHYLVSWAAPNGKTYSLVTNETSFRNNFDTYAGHQFLLTVCLVYLPHEFTDDCAYFNLLMPEGIPSRGPHLKDITRISNKVIICLFLHYLI